MASRGGRLSSLWLGGRLSVAVEPSFWLVAALLAAFSGARSPRGIVILAAVIAVSVLLHELGHAAASLSFGSGADVVLHSFGGTTRSRAADEFTTRQRLVVTASGCALGLVLAFATAPPSVALWAYRVTGSVDALFAVRAFHMVNLYWSLFNLMPIMPMDGGSLVATALRARWGLNGLRAAHLVGAACAGAAALWFWAGGSGFNAVLVGLFAVGEVHAFRRALSLSPADEDEGMRRELEDAQEAWGAGRREEAVRRLVELRRKTGRGAIHRAATVLLAHALNQRGRERAVYELLKPLRDEDLPFETRLMLQEAALRAGDAERSVRLGQANFQLRASPETAYLVAAACAARGDARLSAQWMRTAARKGLPQPRLALQRADFDPVRGTPEFKDLEETLDEAR
jgi:Zn-dependent protease